MRHGHRRRRKSLLCDAFLQNLKCIAKDFILLVECRRRRNRMA
jgi:hypothetical protein